MNTIEFRFGRNVNGMPMDVFRWEQFRNRAVDTLKGVAAGAQNVTRNQLTQRVEVHTGTGSWENFEGEIEFEDSAVVTLYSESFFFDPSHPDFHLTLDMLTEFASELAQEFEQEAVAVVYGKSALATQKVGA